MKVNHTLEKKPQLDYPLTKSQQYIFDLVESSAGNFLIHGKPGVGKSVLIWALKTLGLKPYILGAPTGLAATNIGGKTLHSIFAIPSSQGIVAPDYNVFSRNPNVQNYLRFTLKHLIIDEISMVRCDVLDFIDRTLKYFKGNDLPFGGVQIIAVGDFFQLPPIVNREDKEALKAAGYKSEFAFDAFCFQSFAPLILDEVLRQKGDDKFIKILHGARSGEIQPKYLAELNKKVGKCKDFRIRLTGANRQAEDVNLKHLYALPGPEREYHADSFGDWPDFPAQTVLELRVGAQVLVKKNGSDRVPGTRGGPSRIVNGTIGIVVELPEEGEALAIGGEKPPVRVMIQLEDGEIVPIYRARWERKVKEKINGVWEERVVASFEQIPLQLAWAISMHKSQGQTFEAVHVDPSVIFAAGQLYVAISRCKSLAGLSFESTVKPQMFFSKNRVIDFEQSIINFSKLKSQTNV